MVSTTIPWYIIDPTGAAIRRQRLYSAAKSKMDDVQGEDIHERMTSQQRASKDVTNDATTHLPGLSKRHSTFIFRRRSVQHRPKKLGGASWSLILWSNTTLFPAWDLIGAVALLFTAAVTPFEVGFLPPPATASDPLFVINRIVDGVFILDVVFQFFIMVPMEVKDDKGLAKTAWEMDPRKLALRYTKGWFFLDVISIAPSVFDIMPVVSNDGPRAGGAKALRTLRALRLIKLLRLVRASRMFQRAKERISLSSVTVTLISLLLQTGLLTHALACTFAITTTFADSRLETWMGTFGYCRPPPDYEASSPSAWAARPVGVEAECVSVAYAYLMCLFWAFTLITGYSADPPDGPYGYHGMYVADAYDTDSTTLMYNPGEYVALLCVLLAGVFSWTIIFGRLVVALTNADPDHKRFTESLDSINRFCERQRLGEDLKMELRRYFFHTIEVHQYESRMQALARLSPALIEKVVWYLNKDWLLAVPCFKFGRVTETERRRFLCNMVLRMRPLIFAPKEVPPGKRLYYVEQGSVMYHESNGKKKTLGPGQCWGWRDVLLWRAKPLRAVTNTYVHLLSVSRDDFIALREPFPRAFFAVKTWTMFREIVAYFSQQMRHEQAVAAAHPERSVRMAKGDPLPLQVKDLAPPPAIKWSAAQLDALGTPQLLELRKAADAALEKRMLELESQSKSDAQYDRRSHLAA